MPFDPKQMDAIRSLEESPCDCLLCGGRACLAVTERDLERVAEAGRVNLRCGKCGVKLTISA
jgi:hypothetical protein